MIDPESIQNHSRIVQGPPGYQKMTCRAYFLHRKCSIRVIRGQGEASQKNPFPGRGNRYSSMIYGFLTIIFKSEVTIR